MATDSWRFTIDAAAIIRYHGIVQNGSSTSQTKNPMALRSLPIGFFVSSSQLFLVLPLSLPLSNPLFFLPYKPLSIHPLLIANSHNQWQARVIRIANVPG